MCFNAIDFFECLQNFALELIGELSLFRNYGLRNAYCSLYQLIRCSGHHATELPVASSPGRQSLATFLIFILEPLQI